LLQGITDVDEQKLEMYHFGEAEPVDDGDVVRTRHLRGLKDQVEQQLGERRLQTGPCQSYQVIQIAIAYESRFCSFFGGKDAANNIVQTIIAETSVKYNQFCKKVALSHLEGYCSQAEDPYFNMFSGSVCGDDGSQLTQFRNYWASNRQSVTRDTAHLFHAFAHPTSTIGCAYIGALCSNDYAYGVDEITFGRNDNQNLWAVLVAHELGHNAGAK
jgi:Metallo-peptidase family M12